MIEGQCCEEGCTKEIKYRKRCEYHYRKLIKQELAEGVRVRKRCKIEGCYDFVISNGLCDMHRNRLRKTGTTDPPEWVSMGRKEDHHLYNTWIDKRRLRVVDGRPPMCREWLDDFWLFVKEVGERPSKKFRLYQPDCTQPLSKDNAVWSEELRVHDRNDKKKYNEYQKKYRTSRYKANRNAHLKKHFGISLEDYVNMKDFQGGVCDICKKPETKIDTRTTRVFELAVDHCHSTGKIRGLLCGDCNRALGMFKDSVSSLQNAIKYLEK